MALTAEFTQPLKTVAHLLLQISDYAVRQLNSLETLLQEDDCQQSLTAQDYKTILESISIDINPTMYASALRSCRHRHLLRLLLRELANLADTRETMTEWSDFADAVITQTLRYCQHQLFVRFGKPTDLSQLYVLAMGKLGGRELNYSSDIDLIFAFSESGNTSGPEMISHQEFYSKVVQQFMSLLQSITAEGFVFRVDLRLRPNGDSGPLVSSLFALETYYQEQGRDWERYAMVKARLIDASLSGQQWFSLLIKPFVYRRYVDFGVIESLRGMKAMIEREIQLNPMLDDIKRGRGGIREIEFIIQCFQLIRGGRLPKLQQQNALLALRSLKEEGLLVHTSSLRKAYLFFRKLENALQTQNDQQTHSLPIDTEKQSQIMRAMGYMSWDDLLHQLHQYQRIVSRAFHAVLGQLDSPEDEKRLLLNQLTSIWQGHVETTMAVTLLASLGFHEPERCYQMIHAFRHSPRCRHLSQAARLRLDRFMVLLLSELMSIHATDLVLLSVLHLLENIVGRSAYLALLTENLHVLKELLHWFAHSPFVTELLVSQPFLLEVLLDQKQSWKPLSRVQLDKELKARLTHCNERELQDEVLRQFKLTCWLKAARAELYGHCDAVRIGRFLSDVADVLITQVFHSACEQLSERHPCVLKIKSRFAIVAYGKLGSREMNYDSDVDLVFLHAVAREDEHWVTRLTRKIIHKLTMRSQAGLLYAVDTRLRPSGEAGLLVSHIDAFVDYQSTQAWVWEHQALLKARVLLGSSRIKLKFHELKHAVLFVPREKEALCNDVKSMRAKISQHSINGSIKHVAGGLLDLEFLVQFLALAYPQKGFVLGTNTLTQLRLLYTANHMTRSQFLALTHAYRQYHDLLHGRLLRAVMIERDEEQAHVLSISQLLYFANVVT